MPLLPSLASEYATPPVPLPVVGEVKPGSREKMDTVPLSVKSAVEQWVDKIEKAETRWDPDFKRMRENMEFAAGLQRPGQGTMDCEAYVCNLVNRTVNQKVSALYARNPTAEWQRRKRMDFSMWDEHIESIAPLIEKMVNGFPLAFHEQAIISDYFNGMQYRELVEKVGKTLEILYQYNVDEHDPDFKLQMKQLVRRVITTGVGYVRVGFARDIESTFTSAGLDNSVPTMAKRLKSMLDEMEEGGYDESDARMEHIKQLAAAFGVGITSPDNEQGVKERLVFDFLPSTCVIPDENCRCLKGFVGARFLAIKYTMPLAEVNEFFEVDLTPQSITKGGEARLENLVRENYDDCESLVTFWEVLDKKTRSHFFVTKGYDNYLLEPEALEPHVRGFWPVFALTFNDIEVEEGQVVSIFPPSDVQLMKHPQKETNRSREELRAHRIANAPKYPIFEGTLDPKDFDKLSASPPHAVIPITNTGTQGIAPSDLVKPMQHAPLDPALYDTSQFYMDILNTVGMQDANLGQPNPQGTATGQTIAEQSRLTGVSSNIDDLDDFLSCVAKASGDIALQSFSQDTVLQIVGPGAIWPADNRAEFLNEISLKIVAASSGRPNKAMEIANWERLLPYLMQMGANPHSLVRETIKRADDRIEPEDMFPLLPGMATGAMPSGPQQGGPVAPPGAPVPQGRPGPGPRQPLQRIPSEQLVPLAGQ